jgi:hypothetical protein
MSVDPCHDFGLILQLPRTVSDRLQIRMLTAATLNPLFQLGVSVVLKWHKLDLETRSKLTPGKILKLFFLKAFDSNGKICKQTMDRL